jgi:lactate permease
MNTLVSVSPFIFVLILSAWYRRPAFIVAWCGVIFVAALIVFTSFLQVEPSSYIPAFSTTAVITLQASLVIGPGLYLNSLLSRTKAHDALMSWIEQLPMDPLHKRLMIVVGLAPALESLTGFGVSLLVTVPLLLAVSERHSALCQSMLSMNIMPWGTLGLATAVGAQLSGQPVSVLGFSTSIISFGVFPMFGMFAGWLSAKPLERSRACRDGFLLGSVLSLCLVTLNWLGVTELAGIFAGVTSTLTCLLLFRIGNHLLIPSWNAVRPYAIVLSLIAVIRALPFLGVPTKEWAIEIEGVHFAPLASPGLAMVVAILFLDRLQDVFPLLYETIIRAMKPILALGGFTLMAQMMVASGMIGILGEALQSSNPLTLGPLSSLLGALSGYLTGSNVGGNALMMTMQASLSAEKEMSLVFSAIQNSTAGHAVFASMPIILLVLAVAGHGEKTEESTMVRFGLKTLLMTLAVQVLTTILFISVLSLN